jgi:hypothetical protein
VLLVTAPRALAVPIPQELAAALDAAQELLKFAAAGDAVSPGAKRSRRNLQHRAIALLTAYELGAGARQQDRRFAEGLWPAVVTHNASSIGCLHSAGHWTKPAAMEPAT